MRAGRPKFLTRRTRAERQKQRKDRILADAAISVRTQERYYDAMRKLLPTLEKVKGPPQLDDAVSDWVEKQWREGQTIHVVSDALCGLHHFEPYTKKLIPSAWKLFRTWRKLEAPNRAPPLTKYIIYSLAHYAMMHNDLVFGTLLLMGFFGLLRTGELLLVKPCNILVAKERVILSLESTKSGKRNAASETVSFDDPFAVIAIDQLLQLREHQRLQHVPCWLHSAQNFRNKFSFYLKKFDLKATVSDLTASEEEARLTFFKPLAVWNWPCLKAGGDRPKWPKYIYRTALASCRC